MYINFEDYFAGKDYATKYELHDALKAILKRVTITRLITNLIEILEVDLFDDKKFKVMSQEEAFPREATIKYLKYIQPKLLETKV